jgi:hypothetical protein
VFVTRGSKYLKISTFLNFFTFIPIYSGSLSFFFLFIVYLIPESSVAKSDSDATFVISSTDMKYKGVSKSSQTGPIV